MQKRVTFNEFMLLNRTCSIFTGQTDIQTASHLQSSFPFLVGLYS